MRDRLILFMMISIGCLNTVAVKSYNEIWLDAENYQDGFPPLVSSSREQTEDSLVAILHAENGGTDSFIVMGSQQTDEGEGASDSEGGPKNLVFIKALLSEEDVPPLESQSSDEEESDSDSEEGPENFGLFTDNEEEDDSISSDWDDLSESTEVSESSEASSSTTTYSDESSTDISI